MHLGDPGEFFAPRVELVNDLKRNCRTLFDQSGSPGRLKGSSGRIALCPVGIQCRSRCSQTLEKEEEMMKALAEINYVPNQNEIVNEVARRVARRLAQARKAQKKMNEALGRK